MVGDHLDDLLCGKGANAVTFLLRNKHNPHFEEHADIKIDSLEKIIDYLQEGFDVNREINDQSNL